MTVVVDSQLLEQADQDIRRTFSSVSSLIVVKQGEVVFSNTYDRGDSVHALHPVYSITKSVISALIGIAIDKGYIKSTDQTLSDLIDADHCPPVHSPVGEITLHQLLSMSCGFLWRDGQQGNEPMLARMLKQTDWLRFILKLPVDASMVGHFQYNSAVSHLLSVIISQKTGMSTREFAESTLFSHLGVADYQWSVDPQGYTTGGWGLQLAPVDLVKFGTLFLAQGKVSNKVIVSKKWTQLSTSAHCQVLTHDHVTGYGYQWWLCQLNDLPAFCARGLGGQLIYCVPALDVVIVLTSSLAGRRKNAWPVFQKYLLPALSVS